MSPKVYISSDEVAHLLDPGVAPVAYEWQGENVFRVFICRPVYPLNAANIPVYSVEIRKEGTRYLRLFESNEQVRIKLIDNDIEEECEIALVPGKEDLYSRAKGLIESSVLEHKSVAIIGLGSFGSVIAVELAKSGLGKFKFFDPDRLEAGNIMRHACGLNDIGRFKTNAVRDQILQRNPYAKVETYNININKHLGEFKAAVADVDLIICVTDENPSRVNICQIALELETVVLFGRAITRAEGGDILRFRPRKGPCMACLTGKGIFKYTEEEISSQRQSSRDAPAYASPDDAEAKVQVGLSSDIMPLCNMIIKLALVEFSRGIDSGIESLDEEFEADYYFWVNRRERKYRTLVPLKFNANRPTILRWYGVHLEKNPNCLICGNS
jgi:molybdopterin/thiamine biosynthesis adenylyltransferase